MRTKRRMWAGLLILGWTGAFAAQAWAAAFELRESDAREAAMGGNIIAGAEGANIVTLNPALLGELLTPEIKATQHDLMGMGLLLQDTVSFVYPWAGLGIGVGYNRLSTNNLSFIDYQENTFIFSGGARIGRDFDIGASTKFYYANYAVNATGWGSDLAVNYRPLPWLTTSLVGSNLLQAGLTWSSQQWDRLPQRVSLGLTGKWLRDQLILQVAANHSLEPGDQVQVHAGGELRLFDNQIALRGGVFNIENNWMVTFGLGVKYAGIKLEYAFLPHYELGDANIFSLAIEL